MSFVGKPQTPVGAFRPSMDGKSVRRGRAFRAGIGQLLLRCLNSGIHALAMPARSAAGLRGLSTGHPALTPNWFASMRTTLRAFLRPPAAAEGPRVEQRAILARTFQNGQIKSSAAANLGSALAPALVFAFPLYHRVRATMARCSPGAPVRR